VGAGAIGGTLAHLGLLKGWGDVVLFDVAPGLAEGKALDSSQITGLLGSHTRIQGSQHPHILEGCDVVIVTAGSVRTPGMSRSDLLLKNAAVIQTTGNVIREHAPESFVIVVTNPLDAMVWLMQKTTNFPARRVVGMAGLLDSARFTTFLGEQMGVSPNQIQTLVLGGHGDLMVPLVSHTSVAGISLDELIAQGRIEKSALQDVIRRTREAGGEIVALLRDKSAFYAPATAALVMAEAFLTDAKRLLPCAAWLEEEAYGVRQVYAGVPVLLGRQGVEAIWKLSLSEEEQLAFQDSTASVRLLIEELEKWLLHQKSTNPF
jgi:malate dehydrogenase